MKIDINTGEAISQPQHYHTHSLEKIFLLRAKSSARRLGLNGTANQQFFLCSRQKLLRLGQSGGFGSAAELESALASKKSAPGAACDWCGAGVISRWHLRRRVHRQQSREASQRLGIAGAGISWW